MKKGNGEYYSKDHPIHIRYKRMKRFSNFNGNMVDNLFEQWTSYCESVDKGNLWNTSERISIIALIYYIYYPNSIKLSNHLRNITYSEESDKNTAYKNKASKCKTN